MLVLVRELLFGQSLFLHIILNQEIKILQQKYIQFLTKTNGLWRCAGETHSRISLGEECPHTYQSCAVALVLQYFGKSGFIWRKPS